MDLKQLRYFTAVVDAGCISAAAKKLHISQPPLSTQMKSLENELGVVLFERGLRSITLTDAGKLLYQRANAMLNMESVTKREIGNIGRGVQGTLRLGMVSSSVTDRVFDQLKRFHDEHSRVDFQIYEGNTFELLDKLKTNQIDLALVRAPFPETGFVCRKYMEDPMVAAGMNKNFGENLDFTNIASQPIIMYRRWESTIRGLFEQHGLQPDILCMADTAWTCLQMARTGMGVAILPKPFVSDVEDMWIYPLDEIESRLTLVRRADGYLSNITEMFFNEFEL